jgi:hypothetical protein
VVRGLLPIGEPHQDGNHECEPSSDSKTDAVAGAFWKWSGTAEETAGTIAGRAIPPFVAKHVLVF